MPEEYPEKPERIHIEPELIDLDDFETIRTPETELTIQEILDLLIKLREQGLDFEEEDAEHILAMELDEAIGYLYIALAELGVAEIEEFLKEKGILE